MLPIKLECALLKEQNKLELEKKENKLDELARKIILLELMLKHQNNLVLVDVLDSGKSREDILSRIRSFTAVVPTSVFEFNAKNEIRNRFDYFIFQMAFRSSQLLREKIQLSEAIQDLQNKVVSLIKQKNLCKQSENPTYQQLVDEQQALIQYNRATLEKLEGQIKLLEDERRNLDSDEPVIYWQDKYSRRSFLTASPKSVAILGATGAGFVIAGPIALLPLVVAARKRAKAQKKFDYKGIRYDKVDIEHSNGVLTNVIESKEDGQYSALFKPNADKAKCTISIVIKKRNLPESALRFISIATELDNLNQEQKKILKEKDKLLNEMEVLKKYLKTNKTKEEIEKLNQHLGFKSVSIEEEIKQLRQNESTLWGKMKELKQNERENKEERSFIILDKIVAIFTYSGPQILEYQRLRQKFYALPELSRPVHNLYLETELDDKANELGKLAVGYGNDDYFQDKPVLSFYYNCVIKSLENIFLSYKAAAGGAVRPQDGALAHVVESLLKPISAFLPAITMAAKAAEALGYIGHSVLIPAKVATIVLEVAFSATKKIMIHIDEKLQKQIINNLSNVCTLNTAMKISGKTALYLTLWINEYLTHLSPVQNEKNLDGELKQQLTNLANFAVLRVLEYLIVNETSSSLSLEDLPRKLYEAVAIPENIPKIKVQDIKSLSDLMNKVVYKLYHQKVSPKAMKAFRDIYARENWISPDKLNYHLLTSLPETTVKEIGPSATSKTFASAEKNNQNLSQIRPSPSTGTGSSAFFSPSSTQIASVISNTSKQPAEASLQAGKETEKKGSSHFRGK